ncbi:MAG: hypothetical protein F6J89_13820 [Symploca sp. SIO1C4]|uniref:Uncharacterized protein n=1 Tax=Symploca sp. SIO1C4 TaxID=2607765 RepID=A0A6B3NAX0_9CYAN|nr:hypothetical protein [Symploca sp. SIO1C4]
MLTSCFILEVSALLQSVRLTRRRSEAEAYLKTLQGLMPNLKHIIIFDIEPEDTNQALQENKKITSSES